jgi:hypothetical protein
VPFSTLLDPTFGLMLRCDMPCHFQSHCHTAITITVRSLLVLPFSVKLVPQSPFLSPVLCLFASAVLVAFGSIPRVGSGPPYSSTPRISRLVFTFVFRSIDSSLTLVCLSVYHPWSTLQPTPCCISIRFSSVSTRISAFSNNDHKPHFFSDRNHYLTWVLCNAFQAHKCMCYFDSKISLLKRTSKQLF